MFSNRLLWAVACVRPSAMPPYYQDKGSTTGAMSFRDIA